MQIHELQPKNKLKSAKRVGRGGIRGTYSGKGMKGQNSRAGAGGKHPVEKGRDSWVKKFPKMGGFKSVYLSNIVIKTSVLENQFKAGDEVSPKSLQEYGIVKGLKRGKSRKLQLIKVLFDTPLKKKLIISGCLISKKARKEVEKAGGEVKNIAEKKVKQEKNVKSKYSKEKA